MCTVSGYTRGTSSRDGWLLYIKPALDGDEPADIRAYASRDKSFPHQSTADQFFSETQFESYRALGAYSLDRILEEDTEMTLSRLLRLFFLYHVTEAKPRADFRQEGM